MVLLGDFNERKNLLTQVTSVEKVKFSGPAYLLLSTTKQCTGPQAIREVIPQELVGYFGGLGCLSPLSFGSPNKI